MIFAEQESVVDQQLDVDRQLAADGAARLDALRQRALLESTLIVVTSDHGYSFWDRDWDGGYGFSLFDEMTRVPLLVLAPDSRAGRRVEMAVSQVDIAATLTEYAAGAAEAKFNQAKSYYEDSLKLAAGKNISFSPDAVKSRLAYLGAR